MNGQLKEDMANYSNEFADWSSPDKIFWMSWLSEVSVLQLGDKCVVLQKNNLLHCLHVICHIWNPYCLWSSKSGIVRVFRNFRCNQLKDTNRSKTIGRDGVPLLFLKRVNNKILRLLFVFFKIQQFAELPRILVVRESCSGWQWIFQIGS